MFDVLLLEKLTCTLLTYEQIMSSFISVIDFVQSMEKEKICEMRQKSLDPFKEVLSKMILKRMAHANISYE